MNINKTYVRKGLAGILCACLAIVLQSSALAEEADEAGQIRRIRQIVLSRGDDPTGLAHLIQLSSDLQPAAAAELYRQLADAYLRAGQLEQAAEVLHQLVDQHLDQPPAVDGLLTLVWLYSSSEVAHTAKKSLRKTGENAMPVYALYLAQQALGRQRDLANNPALAFQCAVASRLTGNLQSAKSWLSPLKHSRHDKSWHQCALVETWLQGPRDTASPKPTMRCSRTDERPLLDGVLGEKLWQVAKTQAEDDDSAQIRWACDAKFLYLAIRCQKLAGENYASEKLPRRYDADLTGHDHVRLSLDRDRDYATCFQFSIDHRGQTADRCWLDASWNPRWFVAANSDDTSWTVEAAIPWTELIDRPPQAGDAWALAVDRQSANEAAPESFGLLIFD
ncbi:MAG: hypothetical protein GXP28_09330 [Planctomycetes bacterium]|nr:hypothetical protein [Planctomycetota bacterium]